MLNLGSAAQAAEKFGGKAAVLIELQSAGFNVPDFLVSPTDIEYALSVLGTPLAVRSSATVEDGRTLSFSGQFGSYLDLNSLMEVEAAFHKCRASLHSTSVVEYCRRNRVDPTSLKMEIILQRMIQPELAGVAFTLNPVTGDDKVTIEACEGAADELLAGRKSALPNDHPLVQRYTPQIETMARRLQNHFGAPQDIEFAIEDGTLFLLQSRPITRIGFAAEIGEWTNAVFRDGGVSNGVCTPLMWSLYDFIWEDSLKSFLREIRLLRGDFQAGRMFFCRPYWNLGAVKHCLAKLPGFVERDFDADLSIRVGYEGDGHRTPVTLASVLCAIPALLAIRSIFRSQQQVASKLLAEGFQAIERRYDPLRQDVEAAFQELIERDYYTVERSYFRTIFATSLAKLDFTSSFPEADCPTLISALPELRHMAPIRELQATACAGGQDSQPFMQKLRHHSDLGLDIRFPRWDEEDPLVSELFYNLPVSRGGDPRPTYEKSRAETLSQLPVTKRRSFNRKLDRLRNFVWLREELRDLSSRMYYFIRRYALAIAERRGIGDDIFFMSFREIFADDRTQVKRHRELYEKFRNFLAPNEIGSRFTSDACRTSGLLRGIGASPGTVQGTARVAMSFKQAIRIESGAILICPFIEPCWTPVLDRVAGVVTESGGLLSHAAVICREYGIPAVLGLADATRHIPDGKTILVRGEDGYVELMN